LRDAVKDQIHPISNINQTTIDFEVIEPADEKRFQIIFQESNQSKIITPSNTVHCYPNPTDGNIFINGGVTIINIFNSIGQTVPYSQFRDHHNPGLIIKLDSKLNSGIYFIHHSKGVQRIQLVH